MTEHLSHDVPDSVPAWYRPQPFSPVVVYAADEIMNIQRTLSCWQTGEMDEPTINHIKGLQHINGIDPSGIITLETAQAIQRLRDRYGSQA
jgi:hypothetical protein